MQSFFIRTTNTLNYMYINVLVRSNRDCGDLVFERDTPSLIGTPDATNKIYTLDKLSDERKAGRIASIVL